MLGDIIKAAIAVALVGTGLGWIAGTNSVPFLGKLWWRQKVLPNVALFGLAYLSAKGSQDTTKQNLAIKSAGLNAIAARNIVYGKTRVGGTVVFRGTSGSNNYLLHNVIALAGHEINDLKKIYIDAGQGLVELDLSSDFVSATENGETVYRVTKSAFVNTDNDNAYTSGSLIKVSYEKGDQTTANGYAVNNIGDAWTTDHKLQGIAYIYIACVFDLEKFTRYPEFSFEVEGKKVVDPRVHATNRTFSSNPALIIRDYLKDNVYGFGATDTEISDATSGAGFKQAADDCDDDITTTGSSTEDRFTLNGEFGSNEEPQRVLEHMLTSCGGQLTYNNGQFALFVGKARTASGSITDDKILTPVQITTKASGMGSANGVKATYVRPSDNYIGGEITPYKDSTFLTEDTPSGEASANYEKYMNLTFPYTHTTFTAQRLARMALNYTRQDQTLSVLVPIEFLSYQVGDVVNFTNERLGYDGKDFEITNMSFEFMNDNYLAVRLNLKEYDSAIFNTFTYTTDPTLPTAPSSGDTSVSPPTSLTLTEFVKTGSVIKSASVFVKANWTNAVDEKIVKTVVMYKRSTDSNFDAVDVGYPNNHFHIKADTGITYDVKAYHVSVAGIHSADTSVAQITVGAEAVTLNTGTIGGITIAADKLYEGTGTFNNSNTGFYLDDDGQFSLKDKLSFNGTTLAISGNLTVENTIDAGKITLDGQDLSVLLSASGSGTTGTLTSNTKKTLFNYTDPLGNLIYGLYVDTVNSSLGIGTLTDPSSALHIRHTTPHIRLEDTDTNEYVRIKGDGGNMILEVDLPESDANSYLGIDVDNGERARFTSSGLGIGTTSPSANLDVVGGGSSTAPTLELSPSTSTEFNHAINAFNSNLTAGENSIIVTGKAGSTKNSGYIGYKWNGDASNSNLITFGHWGNDNLLNLTADGKLGIGTESPAQKLHIKDTSNPASTTGSVIIEGQRDGTANLMELRARDNSSTSSALPNGQGGIIRMNGFDGTDFEEMAFIGYQADGAAVADGDAPSRLIFGTTTDGSGATTEKMRLDNAGRLGINTTSPSYKLHLDAASDGINISGASAFVRWNSGDMQIRNAGSYSMAFDTYDGSALTEKMRLDTSGNLAIGTTSAAGNLHVVGAAGDAVRFYLSDADDGTAGGDSLLIMKSGSTSYMYNRDSGDFRLGTNNDNDMFTIDSSGSLGAGTNSPSGGAIGGKVFHLVNSGSTASVRVDRSDSSTSGTISMLDANTSHGLYGTGDKPMAFSTNAAERMRITGGGAIVMGATSASSGQTLTVSGDTTVLGTMTCTTISKISGSFKIDHPLKPKTHSLVHSFVESPQADNTYSGKLRLVKGQAELNLDEYFGMTEGTIVALNRDFRVFTTNESNWDNVKGKVKNNILYIESNNPESMAEVSWLVIGERQDKEIHESELTNEEGKIILEPSK